MSWTKRQLIDQAYSSIGLSQYVFTLQAEQLQVALNMLDGMMKTWYSRGIRVGYPIGDYENSSLDQDSETVAESHEAIYLGLAIRLAGTLGKQVQRETKAAAREAYLALLNRNKVGDMQIPYLPLGQGHKPTEHSDTEFFTETTEPLGPGQDSELEFT